MLATGSSDLPNRLGVPGELANPTWVLHDLRSLEAALDRLVKEEEGDREGKLHGSTPQILHYVLAFWPMLTPKKLILIQFLCSFGGG